MPRCEKTLQLKRNGYGATLVCGLQADHDGPWHAGVTVRTSGLGVFAAPTLPSDEVVVWSEDR